VRKRQGKVRRKATMTLLRKRKNVILMKIREIEEERKWKRDFEEKEK